ncbi:outer membrane protein [Catalinimonas alkaloidigena]|uniref:Outer membrane protein n=1 Tax=Catalinimonas alkaloidigena TaxID=1075417 RepID=A0A1G9E443_9BACT|nr:OmpH family outer membrane protein [Catalinimonas alkaloidigena]SDK70888.1 outer membrane protein [Catalinimonas alkaloidigena]
MKNLSLALNIVLLIAVIVLYVLHFSDRQPVTASAKGDTTGVAATNEGGASVPVIAFVNTDSLLTKYDFFKSNQASLEARGRRAENDLQSRSRTLENEVRSAQQRAQSGSLTQQEAVELEQQIMKKQQDLMAYRDKLTQELAADEQRLVRELNENIVDYLKDYGQKQNYTYVLGYNLGNSNVLFAADSLDITAQVLEGLNQAYAAKNTAKADEKK